MNARILADIEAELETMAGLSAEALVSEIYEGVHFVTAGDKQDLIRIAALAVAAVDNLDRKAGA